MPLFATILAILFLFIRCCCCCYCFFCYPENLLFEKEAVNQYQVPLVLETYAGTLRIVHICLQQLNYPIGFWLWNTILLSILDEQSNTFNIPTNIDCCDRRIKLLFEHKICFYIVMIRLASKFFWLASNLHEPPGEGSKPSSFWGLFSPFCFLLIQYLLYIVDCCFSSFHYIEEWQTANRTAFNIRFWVQCFSPNTSF